MSPVRPAALLAFLALATCAAPPAAPPTSTLDLAVAALPAEAAGFRRDSVRILPSAGLGQAAEATYAGPGARAIVAVFDRGATPVPPGPDSPLARQQLAEAQRNAEAAAAARHLFVAAALPPRAVSGPNGPALGCVALPLEDPQGRQRLLALACVGGVDGRMVQVRVNLPESLPVRAGEDEAAFSTAGAFATAIVAALERR